MNDLEAILSKAMEALKRDLNHIFTDGTAEKLTAHAARDLVAYIKLLTEIQDRNEDAKDTLSKMPADELKKLAHELLSK